jgi:hypothetical protein
MPSFAHCPSEPFPGAIKMHPKRRKVATGFHTEQSGSGGEGEPLRNEKSEGEAAKQCRKHFRENFRENFRKASDNKY